MKLVKFSDGRGLVKLPDGRVVALADWRSVPLSDGTCSKCGHLAALIFVVGSQRFCAVCVPTRKKPNAKKRSKPRRSR